MAVLSRAHSMPALPRVHGMRVVSCARSTPHAKHAVVPEGGTSNPLVPLILATNITLGHTTCVHACVHKRALRPHLARWFRWAAARGCSCARGTSAAAACWARVGSKARICARNRAWQCVGSQAAFDQTVAWSYNPSNRYEAAIPCRLPSSPTLTHCVRMSRCILSV